MHSALKYLGEKDIIYVIYPQMVQKTYCVCLCVEKKWTKELNISSWWIWVKGIQVSFGLFLQLYKVEREKKKGPAWDLAVICKRGWSCLGFLLTCCCYRPWCPQSSPTWKRPACRRLPSSCSFSKNSFLFLLGRYRLPKPAGMQTPECVLSSCSLIF